MEAPDREYLTQRRKDAKETNPDARCAFAPLRENSLSWFTYLHLADSALPAGGFAFSGGLESAARIGIIQNRTDLEQYLGVWLEQLGDFDLPFIRSLADPSCQSELSDIISVYDAMLNLPSINRASRAQGRGWLRLTQTMISGAAHRTAAAQFESNDWPTHILCAFVLVLGALGCHVQDRERLYGYIGLRDQISAAIRLGLLGPQEGHALQENLLARFDEIREESPERRYHDACRTSPGMDVAQGYHEHLYSRLFQS
jgi:urease accessory protein